MQYGVSLHGLTLIIGRRFLAQQLLQLTLKLRKTWLKLLKAESKRNEEKVARLEAKLLKLELKYNEMKES